MKLNPFSFAGCVCVWGGGGCVRVYVCIGAEEWIDLLSQFDTFH